MKGNVLDNKKLRENPFRTPVGYFQNVKTELMASLPDAPVTLPAKRKHTVLSLRPLLTMAASVCIAVFGVVAYTHYFDAGKSGNQVNTQISHHSDDDASDYIIMDNSDIYNYIAEL